MSKTLSPVEREFQFTKQCYEACTIPVSSEVGKIQEKWVEAEDGIKLRTICFLPKLDGRIPVVVQRLCYPQKEPVMRMHAEEFCKRGIAFVFQFCRGTGGSQGDWKPNTLYEQSDGLALIRWLEAQDWVGDIGYFGSSYMAMCGWAMVENIPPSVKTMYLTHYGTDRFVSMYEAGLFRHDIGTGWAKSNAGFPIEADYMESCLFRPNIEVDEKLWGRKVDWYREYLTSTKASDPLWNSGLWKVLKEAPSKANIPLYMGEAWFDHHFGSALTTYCALNESSKCCSTLRIGCWEHNFMPCLQGHIQEHLENNNCETALNWFVNVLRDRKIPEKRIELYIIGLDEWRTFEHYPVQTEHEYVLYLSRERASSRSCSLKQCLATDDDSVRYTYDPKQYVPTCGGESVYSSRDQRGSVKQPPPGYRDDVLSFVSNPIQEDMLILGSIKVELFVSSSAPDTSFVAKISEIFENGESYNIRTAITTLSHQLGDGAYRAGDIVKICLHTWDIGWKPKKGSRIRLDVTSSDFPEYAIHSNYEGKWSMQATTQKAIQTIYMGEKYPSGVTFYYI